MRIKSKITFGIVTIIFAVISAGIGFWLLDNTGETYTFAIRFVLLFFLIATPVITILAVINLSRKD